MAELKVALRNILCGRPPRKTLVITINGRQALEEGPRRQGHCVYCAGPCRYVTSMCDIRVFYDPEKAKR